MPGKMQMKMPGSGSVLAELGEPGFSGGESGT